MNPSTSISIRRPSYRAILPALAACLIASGQTHAAATADLGLDAINALLASAPAGATDVSLGDMKFKVAFLTARRDALAATPSEPSAAVLWTDGVVPFTFDASVTSEQKAKFLAACAVWSEVSSLNFVARDTQADYIEVTSGIANEAHVGMQGGKQTLSILNWDYKFIIAHQIGHALGLAHEDTRSDRDSHVNVATAAIQASKLTAFDKLATADLTAYDFDSLMHRGRTAYAKATEDTLIPLAPDEAKITSIGKMAYLSALDVAGIQELYGSPQAGSFDPTFVSPAFQPTNLISAPAFYSTSHQADGKILVAGKPVGSSPGVHMARLNSDGSLDETFAPTTGDIVEEARVLPDGRILATGDFYVVNGVVKSRIAALKADGSLDSGFSIFGVTEFSGVVPEILSTQVDGKLLAAYPGNPSVLRRLLPDGSEDASFTPASFSRTSPGANIIGAILPGPDEKILVRGTFSTVNGSSKTNWARLLPDGSLDASFTQTSLGGTFALQRDGKILLASSGNVTRLNPDGSVDPGFQVTTLGSSITIDELRVQADGKILVRGNFEVIGGVIRSDIARLNPDGSVDESFDSPFFDSSVADGFSLPQTGKPVMGNPAGQVVRMENDAALSNLTVNGAPGDAGITWSTGGAFPETTAAAFSLSLDNGSTWLPLGTATGDPSAWTLDGLDLPSSGLIRATGGGLGASDSSTGTGFAFVESRYVLDGAPRISVGTADGALSTGDSRLLGSARPGQSTTATFTLANMGEEELNNIGATIGGTDAALFTLTTPPPAVLAAGAEATVVVTFAPGTTTATGAKAASLAIASNDPLNSPFTLSLAATAMPAPPVLLPEIAVEQPAKTNLVDGKAKKSFGTAIVGRSGGTKTFTIRNTGTAPLTGLAVSTTGKNAKDFIVFTPKIASIPAGGKVTFRVIFKPTGAGARNATLRILCNDADESPFTVKLTGNGSKGTKKDKKP